MVQGLSDQDPASKDLSSPVDPIQDFSQSMNKNILRTVYFLGVTP